MYFHCVFFPTILTVPQNIWNSKFPIIPECYIVPLIISSIFDSPGVCFVHPQTERVKFDHPIK